MKTLLTTKMNESKGIICLTLNEDFRLIIDLDYRKITGNFLTNVLNYERYLIPNLQLRWYAHNG